MKNDVIYSFSKLSTYHQCPYQYFLKYVLAQRSEENIYTLLGSTIHSIVEYLQEDKITKEEGLERFNSELEFNKILGFTFGSDKIEKNYKESIQNFIKNFEKVHHHNFEIEKKVEFEIEGHKLIGYIDLLLYNSDGSVTIIDYKSSTKYSKEKMKENGRQLVLYGLAMESLGYKVKDLRWNMLKYATIAGKGNRTKTVIRSELFGNEDLAQCYVSYPFNNETKEDTIKWVISTIKEIELKDELFDYWGTNYSSYFCNNLCGFSHKCETCKLNKKNYFERR